MLNNVDASCQQSRKRGHKRQRKKKKKKSKTEKSGCSYYCRVCCFLCDANQRISYLMEFKRVMVCVCSASEWLCLNNFICLSPLSSLSLSLCVCVCVCCKSFYISTLMKICSTLWDIQRHAIPLPWNKRKCDLQILCMYILFPFFLLWFPFVFIVIACICLFFLPMHCLRRWRNYATSVSTPLRTKFALLSTFY